MRNCGNDVLDDQPWLLFQDYLYRAQEFYDAFRQLPAGAPPSWPRYFRLCHAIELALKAFLALHGATPKELRNNFRHKLELLTDKAVAKGLGLRPCVVNEIKLLDEAHRKHWPRYPRHEGKPVFVIDQFEPYVVELLEAVSAAGPAAEAAVKTGIISGLED